jgi:hypothetical protein
MESSGKIMAKLIKQRRSSMSDEIQTYIAEHREDLHYALKEGDRWTRTIVIAALIEAGQAEVELAKQELEQQSERDFS